MTLLRYGLVLALFLLIDASSAATKFDRKAWQDDFLFLKKQLEQRYSNLAWMASAQSGVVLARLDRRTERALAQATDDDEAKAAILGFVSAFHDGHLSPLQTLQTTTEKITPPPEPIFDALNAPEACAALGYASTQRVPFSLPFESLDKFSLVSDGMTTPFRVGVVTAPGGVRLGLLRIKYFRERDYPTVCAAVVLQMKREGLPVNRQTIGDRVDDAWFAALAGELRQLREKAVDAVVVDVSGNGGGNDAGDWSARLFSDKAVHSARLLVSAVPGQTGYLDEEIDGLREALKQDLVLKQVSSITTEAVNKALAEFEHRRQAAANRACDLSWVWREQRAWDPAGCSRLIDAGYASGPVDYLPPPAAADKKAAATLYWPAVVDPYLGAWAGKTYVLTDGKTYSSAEMFAAVMHDNGVAKLVGMKTGGDGCGFMHQDPPVVLPNSHLRFRVPNCVRLRADGSDEVFGIEPDIFLPPLEGEDERARAMRFIAAIATDVRRTK